MPDTVLSRRKILVGAGAIAGGSALPGAAGAASVTAASPGADPILALITEERRFRDLGCALQDKAILILRDLPEDICKGPRVIFRSRYGDIDPKPADRIESKPYHFPTEEALRHWLDIMGRAWRSHYFTEARCAEIVAEWRADKAARVDPVLDASGYAACQAEGDALVERAGDLFELIEETTPTTLAGVIAILELADYERDPLIVRAVEALRAMLKGGAV